MTSNRLNTVYITATTSHAVSADVRPTRASVADLVRRGGKGSSCARCRTIWFGFRLVKPPNRITVPRDGASEWAAFGVPRSCGIVRALQLSCRDLCDRIAIGESISHPSTGGQTRLRTRGRGAFIDLLMLRGTRFADLRGLRPQRSRRCRILSVAQ